MNDESKFGDAPQNESDPVVLLKKIQQHLVFLEKKIDALIAQPQSQPHVQGQPSFKRNFSRPARPFGHPHGAGRGKHPHRPGAGGPPSHGRSSHDRPSHDRPFDKPRGNGENRGFFRKKKPFFRQDKG